MASTPKSKTNFLHGNKASPFASLTSRHVDTHDVYIMRTRSLDEDRTSKDDDMTDQSFENGQASSVAALHSSFDATLLRDGDDSCGRIFEDEEKTDPGGPLWDEMDPCMGDVSGRKHLRPRPSFDTYEVNPPGTVRKQPRRIGHELPTKTPGRPRIRPPGSMKKPSSSTPSSAVKRRRAPLPQRQSPMRRAPPTTPSVNLQGPGGNTTPVSSRQQEAANFDNLTGTAFVASPQAMTPTRNFGSTLKSTSKWHNTGPTTASTLLETTFESGSVDTSSPTTTRFRFTSFPASLPRVNNPRNRHCPDSVRKRMPFDGSPLNEVNQSRDDDGTQNTSISSLSHEGGHHHLPLPPGTCPPGMLELNPQNGAETGELEAGVGRVHTQLFADDENFGYSDDDDTADSPVRGMVGRTRLDFNVVLSPPGKETQKKTFEDTAILPLDLNMELSNPYDQRRINSFPSSLSSNTNLANISGCEELSGALTPARMREKERPTTPREVQLHFPLETECSPIPGVREDSRDSAPVREMHAPESIAMPSEGDMAGNAKHDPDESKEEAKGKEDESMYSDSTNGKSRRLRPMPDMSAFESVAVSSRGDRSTDDSATLDSRGVASTQRFLCPPTPVRTPAWANDAAAYNHFFGGRQNSLITTKVLLSCPSQVLEGRSSLENSVLDDDSKSSGKVFRPVGHAPQANESGNDVRGISAEAEDANVQIQVFDPECRIEASKASDAKVTTPHPRIPAPPRLMRRFPPPPPPPQDVGSVVSFSNDFEIMGVLGSGAFADVYKVRSNRDNRLYAVKRNRRQFRGRRDREMALAEVHSMQRLQSVCAAAASTPGSTDRSSYSLYLLFFYRAWQEDGYFFCQTELCCRDTCRELIDSVRFLWGSAKIKYPSLRNLPTSDNPSPDGRTDEQGRIIPTATVWKICHDVAAGLSHIHSHGLVHHDIKPSNIFLVANQRFGAMCKIGDFGMAGEIGSSGDGQEGDTRYMPSEALSSDVRNASADMFSFGLTLFEIASDQDIEMPSEGPGWHELRSAAGPKLPQSRDHDLQNIIKSLTDPDVTKRPTADSILKIEKVATAGHGCDAFLRDYVRDIEEYDKSEEERLAMDNQEDQTPRNGVHRVGAMAQVRSPSLSMLLPAVPALLSPVAQNFHANSIQN